MQQKEQCIYTPYISHKLPPNIRIAPVCPYAEIEMNMHIPVYAVTGIVENQNSFIKISGGQFVLKKYLYIRIRQSIFQQSFIQ